MCDLTWWQHPVSQKWSLSIEYSLQLKLCERNGQSALVSSEKRRGWLSEEVFGMSFCMYANRVLFSVELRRLRVLSNPNGINSKNVDNGFYSLLFTL